MIRVIGDPEKLETFLDYLSKDGSTPEVLGFDNKDRPVVAWYDELLGVGGDEILIRVVILAAHSDEGSGARSSMVDIDPKDLEYPLVLVSYY